MMIGLLVAIVGVFGILGIIGGTSLLKVGEVEDKLNSGDAAAAIATKTVNLNSVIQTIAENGGADGQLTEVGLAEARKQFSNLKKAVVTDETGQNSVCNVAGTIVKRDGIKHLVTVLEKGTSGAQKHATLFGLRNLKGRPP